jgi:hypothetical protein
MRVADSDISRILVEARDGRYLVRVRAVNPSGNTVDIVGYVTAITGDGGIRLSHGDPHHGLVHDFPRSSILRVERVHGA